MRYNETKMVWYGKVCDEMRWGEVRWDEMRWDEMRWMRWDEMRWDEMRWDEMRWDEMRWDQDLFQSVYLIGFTRMGQMRRSKISRAGRRDASNFQRDSTAVLPCCSRRHSDRRRQRAFCGVTNPQRTIKVVEQKEIQVVTWRVDDDDLDHVFVVSNDEIPSKIEPKDKLKPSQDMQEELENFFKTWRDGMREMLFLLSPTDQFLTPELV